MFSATAKDGQPIPFEFFQQTVKRLGTPVHLQLAWIDSKGRAKAFTQTGPVRDPLGILAMAADARVVIGFDGGAECYWRERCWEWIEQYEKQRENARLRAELGDG